MQVILLKDVPKIGRKNDVKNVSDGYAFNFLFSNKLAEQATPQKIKELEKMRKEYDRRRKMIVKRLNDMNLRTLMPHGAFYTFSNIEEYSKNSLKFSNDLLKKSEQVPVDQEQHFLLEDYIVFAIPYLLDLRKYST